MATDEDMEVTAGPREECGGSELRCGAGATACRARGSTQVSTSPQTPESLTLEPLPWSPPPNKHPQSCTPWQLTPFTRAHPPLGTLPAGAAPPGAPSPPDRAGCDLPQLLQPTALTPTPHPHPTLSTRPSLRSRPSCPAPSAPAHSLPAARPAPLRCRAPSSTHPAPRRCRHRRPRLHPGPFSSLPPLAPGIPLSIGAKQTTRTPSSKCRPFIKLAGTRSGAWTRPGGTGLPPPPLCLSLNRKSSASGPAQTTSSPIAAAGASGHGWPQLPMPPQGARASPARPRPRSPVLASPDLRSHPLPGPHLRGGGVRPTER